MRAGKGLGINTICALSSHGKKAIIIVFFILAGLFVTSYMNPFYQNAHMISNSPGLLDDILNEPLLVDANGQIRTTFRTFSDGVGVNSSSISRLMEESNFKQVECGEVQKRFVNSSKEFKTALASSPGSGNTWVRHLIEEATGMYTGSIYNSAWIRHTFKGENTTENVIVIKTHKGVGTNSMYDRVVLIVRDPFETTLAEFNRQHARSKTGIVTRDQFDYRLFQSTLRTKIPNVLKFNINWLEQFPGPMFVLFYDQLKLDLYNSMAKLASFLGTNMSVRDLWCLAQRQEGPYHRPPKPDWLARSRFVDDYMEVQISEGKRRMFDICKNSTRIQTNL